MTKSVHPLYYNNNIKAFSDNGFCILCLIEREAFVLIL